MPETIETATFGGGCFWCLEAVFLDVEGVIRVVPGYAGGQTVNPTYEDVCSGITGHAEVVQVEFQPAVVGYSDLLRIFFATHDPTTRNRQGNDIGTQYRSIILCHSQEQTAIAHDIADEITDARLYSSSIVTIVQSYDIFYPAEAEHHEYFKKNPWSGYCRVTIAPKIVRFRRDFAKRLRKS